MLKKSFYPLIILNFIFSNPLFSQNYKQALGFRFGSDQGITYKNIFKPQTALELIGTFGGRNFGLTGLLEKHGKINQIPQLYWYIGGGGHVNFYDYDNNNNNNNGNNGYSKFGVDGILGLELKLDKIPLLIGIDLKPSLNFDNGSNFYGNSPAVSLRYAW